MVHCGISSSFQHGLQLEELNDEGAEPLKDRNDNNALLSPALPCNPILYLNVALPTSRLRRHWKLEGDRIDWIN